MSADRTQAFYQGSNVQRVGLQRYSE